MKKQIFAVLSAALFVAGAHQINAAVVVSNIDPANPAFGGNSTRIGQSVLIGNRPISLTSVMFQQTGTSNASGESFAVFSRNADGTLGNSQFTGFTVGFDSTTAVSTATATSAFTLQANTGYYFVLTSNTSSNISWTYTSSTDYASAFGATLPATGSSSVYFVGGTNSYFTLAQGPQEIQVNGTALPAVPEPSACVFAGLALAAGAGAMVRRRTVAA